MVTDSNEELVAELDILRGEMATLIGDLRQLVVIIRANSGDWYVEEVADAIKDIIDG